MTKLPARILDRIAPPNANGCALWWGSGNLHGYGQVSWHDRKVLIHRLLWELANGPIPPDKEIHHICEVKNCTTLAHMELVTKSEHRARHRPTHCPRGHEYTPENTYTKFGLQCRVCARDRARAKYHVREKTDSEG